MLKTEQSEINFALGDNFLADYTGKIIRDPKIAIIELIANAWDAYATNIDITWPDAATEKVFSITDDGIGMTKEDFRSIWFTLSYDRIAQKGGLNPPPEWYDGSPRKAYGKNGTGRFASFYFSDVSKITSQNNGNEFSCEIALLKNNNPASNFLQTDKNVLRTHGTRIESLRNIKAIKFLEEDIREYIGARFLTDSNFNVNLNGKRITFGDIPDQSLTIKTISIEGLGEVTITHIDSIAADRTTNQHGIAWWVAKRAVGACSWRGTDLDVIVDGRLEIAKRYTFIVEADFLLNSDAIEADWTGFVEDSETWKKTYPFVQDAIRDIIQQNSEKDRLRKKSALTYSVAPEANKLPYDSKNRVAEFLNLIVTDCPMFGEKDMIQLLHILIKLEKSSSRYELLKQLNACKVNELNDLNNIMASWTIGFAKTALAEIQKRLLVINELKKKLEQKGVREVQELQPIFSDGGLWMFGAEYESLDFTSNKGMTTIFRELFKVDTGTAASKNRPDIMAIPSTLSRASFGDDREALGVAHVVIVELKTTGLKVGEKEKAQVWKYVKELNARGAISDATKVSAFILGDQIDHGEHTPRVEGNVTITPMLYMNLLERAEVRMMGLDARVQGAPFLQEQKEELELYMAPFLEQQSSVT